MTTSTITTAPPARPYGDEYAQAFGAERGPCVITRALPEAEIAVTEIKVVRPFGGRTVPPPDQDGFMIVNVLEDLEGIEYFEGGRAYKTGLTRRGATTIHDMRREPSVLVDRPFHTIQWYVPRTALKALADEANVPCIDDLRHDPAVSVMDDVIRNINIALLPALRASGEVNRIFVDHVTMALTAHVAHAYGGMQCRERMLRGGLAPWQVRRAKEMLAADLTGATSIAEMAAACRLSADHFARAFRRSTGFPPHAWLNKTRVERAMMLLRQAGRTISEVALECGFVDQSHFTRVFARRVGITPSVWRRTVAY